MISKLTSAQAAAIDQMNRAFGATYGNTSLSQFFNDILNTIASGPAGISSAAADIDSLALGGGAFSWDFDNSSGLTFAYKAGRIHNGMSSVNVGAGTLALSASNTNYIEVDRSGAVSSNTTAFTSGRMPLYTVVTGSSTFTAGNVTNAKDLLTLIGPSGVNGAMLSTVAATKEMQNQLGAAISATATFNVSAPCTGAISAAVLVNTSAITTSDTDYWTFAIVNKGAANAGTQQLLDTGTGNTTKATGGSALSANVKRSLQLTTLSIGTELNVTKDDTLVITITKVGSPTAFANAALRLDFAFAN